MNDIGARLIGTILCLASVQTQALDRVVEGTEVEAGKDAATLAVLLHGYTLDAASLADVRNALRRIEGLENVDVLAPDMPFDTFSMASSSRITAELLAAIDRAWRERVLSGKPYTRIVMIGHSMGGLYARKIYAAACGENADAVFEEDLHDSLRDLGAASLASPRPWAGAVERIVLLAGMNRGWSISHHMSLTRAAIMQGGVAVGHVLDWLYGRPPVIFSIRRGSPFVTQLRLQWISMRERARQPAGKKVGGAWTVQLLGTIGDLVSPRDNVDHVSGRDFEYLEVPGSGHRSVIDMDDSAAGRGRQAVLARALSLEGPGRYAVRATDSDLVVNRDVTDVVFVIHGIRDEGYWTQKIARRVQLMAERLGERVIATETSSYGYFPMLSFLQPGARQKKVEWLMDRYTETRAAYPNARYHYVGHSHGTYLLAKALRDYPAVSFDNVVFAGSVVERDFEWLEYVPQRVNRVLNFVATADWVVAFFPKALESIGVQDLGGAGHDGFTVAGHRAQVAEPDAYIVGGHSAALTESMWDSIARFILTGTLEVPADVPKSKEQAKWVSYPATVAPLVWALIGCILGVVLYLLLTLRIREWKKTLVIVAYLGVIWTVLTEV